MKEEPGLSGISCENEPMTLSAEINLHDLLSVMVK